MAGGTVPVASNSREQKSRETSVGGAPVPQQHRHFPAHQPRIPEPMAQCIEVAPHALGMRLFELFSDPINLCSKRL